MLSLNSLRIGSEGAGRSLSGAFLKSSTKGLKICPIGFRTSMPPRRNAFLCDPRRRSSPDKLGRTQIVVIEVMSPFSKPRDQRLRRGIRSVDPHRHRSRHRSDGSRLLHCAGEGLCRSIADLTTFQLCNSLLHNWLVSGPSPFKRRLPDDHATCWTEKDCPRHDRLGQRLPTATSRSRASRPARFRPS